ncbi:MAG: ABC transporter ATP-binding protein/permease [Odoribacteraceae bacterium]|jgi:ATP-binding cassette subfamily B protein|nr:ABC transporter ATP-binding protein/permease [Odoribacteraceae bacterium]
MKKREDVRREISTLKFVWKMAGGEHGKLLAVVLSNILSGLIPAAVAWFVKNYLDSGLPVAGPGREELTLFLSLVIGGIFIKMISGVIMGYAMANVRKNIEIACVQKFSRLPHAHVVDYLDNRVIMSVSLESKMLLGLIPMVYNSFIKAPVTVSAFVLLLLFVSPTLTFVSLLLIGTVIFGALFFRKTVKRLNRATYDRVGDLHQYFAEWLGGYRTFVTSNAVKFIERRVTGVSRETSALSKRLAKIGAIQSLSVEVITITLALLFVIVASRGAFTGKIFNVGELVLFPAAILFIRGEVLKIIAGYMQLAGTESAARRIMDIIEHPVTDPPGNERLDGPVRALTLRNVSFAYDRPARNILDDASVTFTRGQLHAITGRSGAGKTTFINLCTRLRVPSAGAILYDGKDAATLSGEHLTARVGLVEQEPFIFEGTLAENIFFDGTPDPRGILDLLEDLGLGHLASNERELFNTRVGQRGRLLSTGEKQRIAIVRALARDVDVLFLDEATSNLDARNARKIVEYVKRLSATKLVICASHDIMLLREADVIHELSDGKITRLTTWTPGI